VVYTFLTVAKYKEGWRGKACELGWRLLGCEIIGSWNVESI
jgi:hypothetical protein